MVIKTNIDEGTYFIDNITKKQSDKYIPSPKLSLLYTDNKGEQKSLPNVYIDSRTSCIIGKDFCSTYVIDDGYRNIMQRAGYFVLDNYDKEYIKDKLEGNIIHEKLKEELSDIINKSFSNVIQTSYSEKEIYNFLKDNYRISLVLCDNIYIVNKNNERKINGLQYYPFDKNMDNFGTIYCALYMEKESNTSDNPKIIADNILSKIASKSERIHYSSLDVRQPLYYTFGG